MTNIEIVANEVVLNGLMSEEEVMDLIGNFKPLPYMTYQEWRRMGYQVKKGSKAVIKTKLWKKVSKKDKENDKVESKFILVPANLFGLNQVERMAQA